MAVQRVVLAEYFITREETLLFLLRNDFDEPVAVDIPVSLAQLQEFVAAHFHEDHDESGKVTSTIGDKVNNLDETAFQEFFSPFVEPLLSKSPHGDTVTEAGDIVWIVPHSVLHYIPLHAVKIDGVYLAGRNPICYTPSASVMLYCRAKQKPKTGGKALVLGDSLGDLPYSRAEAELIAGLFEDAPALGGDATKELVLNALTDAERRRSLDVLHFACHGYFNSEQALKSGIALATNNGHDSTDRNLTAEEIFSLQMEAQLVTLSACESGINDQRPGDELIGLTRALIYAGTPSVLVSLWTVDDLSTALLMERFYKNWRGGMNKAEALQEAQHWLRTLPQKSVESIVDEVYNRVKQQAAESVDVSTDNLLLRIAAQRASLLDDFGPEGMPFDRLFFWAPFVLIGDWR
jgi:CHAT domain-containing protein